jgi:hypothetical protein
MAQGKTPIFDWEKGEFKTDSQGRVLIAEDAQALEQIILKVHATPRGAFLIYADLDNPELNHKYGSDVFQIMLEADLTEEERNSEIIRAVKDAQLYDPWINDVTNITLEYEEIDGKTQAFASYGLDTIFDTITVKGVAING